MMKDLLSNLCLLSFLFIFSSTTVVAKPFADQKELAALEVAFEREFKSQLEKKAPEDYSLNEITDLASEVSQKIYSAHPELMRKKLQYDLKQLPILEMAQLRDYQLEESIDFLTLLGGSNTSIQEFESLLPAFYGKSPAEIAWTYKNMVVTRTWTPQQFGFQTMVSRFLPDKTYRVNAEEVPTLAVKSYDENLFLFNFEMTESGLLKPIKIQWMKRKTDSGFSAED